MLLIIIMRQKFRCGKQLTICVFLFIILTHVLPAQVTADGNDIDIKIALIGPGKKIYTWWGYITLMIDDKSAGQNLSYDFGIFSFEDNNFIKNFIFGKLLYICNASDADDNISNYIGLNRDLTLYTLDFPPEKKMEIKKLAENSILPENRYFYYQFFNDNCSTRIRDIIDIASEGQFKKQNDKNFHFTLRQQMRLHTWFSPIADWFLCFLAGKNLDKPNTYWNAMFLPSELANNIENFYFTDEDGISKKLVSNKETINQSYGQNPVLDVPNKQWLQGLIAGIIIALFIIIIFFIQAKYPKTGRTALGAANCVLGFFFGTAALILFFMSFFTSHDFTFNNDNLLFISPLLLASIPLGIKYASTEAYDKRIFIEIALRVLWLLSVIGIIISLIINIFPAHRQDNLPYQLLMLPIALTLSLEPKGLKKMFHWFFWRWE